jgi:hypothetical protein
MGDTFPPVHTTLEKVAGVEARGVHSTPGQQIAAFVTLFKQLDTGKWEDDASAHGLTKLVEELEAESSVSLGGSNFVQIEPPNPSRTWDVRNWDTYSPDMK